MVVFESVEPFVVSSELRQAYALTEYVYRAPSGPEVIRKVGDPLETGLPGIAQGYERLAVVTAYNPFSEPLPDYENAYRNARLRSELARRRLEILLALGRDPKGDWKPEESFLVVDPTDDDLDRVMMAFGQNAVLTGTVGGAFELRLHPHEQGRLEVDRHSAERVATSLWKDAWQRLDERLLCGAMADDVVYESQWVFSALEGRVAVEGYLSGKFQTRSQLPPEKGVVIDPAVTRAGGPARIGAWMHDRNGGSEDALALFEIHKGLIRRIDLCMVSLFAPRRLESGPAPGGRI